MNKLNEIYFAASDLVWAYDKILECNWDEKGLEKLYKEDLKEAIEKLKELLKDY